MYSDMRGRKGKEQASLTWEQNSEQVAGLSPRVGNEEALSVERVIVSEDSVKRPTKPLPCEGYGFYLDGGGGWQAGIWGSLPWLPLGQKGTERKGKQRQTGSCQGYGSREDSKNSGRVLPVLRGCVAAGGGPIAGTGWETGMEL